MCDRSLPPDSQPLQDLPPHLGGVHSPLEIEKMALASCPQMEGVDRIEATPIPTVEEEFVTIKQRVDICISSVRWP